VGGLCPPLGLPALVELELPRWQSPGEALHWHHRLWHDSQTDLVINALQKDVDVPLR
jgi:hypothetical protein